MKARDREISRVGALSLKTSRSGGPNEIVKDGFGSFCVAAGCSWVAMLIFTSFLIFVGGLAELRRYINDFSVVREVQPG